MDMKNMDMNIINSILIILIIIIIINHLTNGKIIKLLSSVINNLKNIMGGKSEKMQDINSIFRKLISHSDVKKTVNLSQPIHASKQMSNTLGHKLSRTLNDRLHKYGYKLRLTTLSNNIIYYKAANGKYFKPFFITANLYHKNRKISKLFLKMEVYHTQSTNELLLLYIGKETNNYTNNYSDVLTDNNPNNSNNQNNANQPNIIPTNSPKQSNDIFLKNTHHLEDSSLIPSVVNITPYDTACETQSVCESTCNTATNNTDVYSV